MSYQPRIPTKFSKLDDSEELVFPLAEYAYEIEAAMHTPEATLTGSHGGIDLLGSGLAVKESPQLRLSFVVYDDTPEEVEATVDALLDKAFRYGRGKLWTLGREDTGAGVAETLRWTRARALGMPRVEWEAGEILLKRLSLGFRCDPFWYAEDALYDAALDVDTDPKELTVTNPGTARIYNAVFTCAGTAASGVTITNLTNSYRLKSTRALSGGGTRLRFDAGRPAVETSVDGGTSWSGDYSRFVRRSGQVQLMVLEPGDNVLNVEGLIGTLTIDANAAYH